jgi:hypothetical protein
MRLRQPHMTGGHNYVYKLVADLDTPKAPSWFPMQTCWETMTCQLPPSTSSTLFCCLRFTTNTRKCNRLPHGSHTTAHTTHHTFTSTKLTGGKKAEHSQEMYNGIRWWNPHTRIKRRWSKQFQWEHTLVALTILVNHQCLTSKMAQNHGA